MLANFPHLATSFSFMTGSLYLHGPAPTSLCPFFTKWDQGLLVVQWLRLCAPHAGGMRSIPDQGTKIPHAARRCQEKKKKKKVGPAA